MEAGGALELALVPPLEAGGAVEAGGALELAHVSPLEAGGAVEAGGALELALAAALVGGAAGRGAALRGRPFGFFAGGSGSTTATGVNAAR